MAIDKDYPISFNKPSSKLLLWVISGRAPAAPTMPGFGG